MASKIDIAEFWNEAACGEELYLSSLSADGFLQQAQIRYELEPYIIDFAGFADAKDKAVLEIGVGLGADHQRFAEAGARLSGIDLTPRAIEITRHRFREFGLVSELRVGDAEALSFPDGSFDLVYSWGVIHHSPNTQQAANEIFRVLRPGGECRVMIYHRHSLLGYMLWFRYGLLSGKPLRKLEDVYAKHLESPGTKAYTKNEVREMFSGFENLSVNVQLTHADLLSSPAGQRHMGWLLSTARRFWPRWALKRVCRRMGLFMLLKANKPL